MKRTSLLILTCFSIAVISGCVSKGNFDWETPEYKPAEATAEIRPYKLLVAEIKDERDAKGKKLDACFTGDPVDKLESKVTEALENTGRFTFQDGAGENAVESYDYKLELTLSKLEWFVPNYGGKMVGGAVTGALTGGIGAAIYCSKKVKAFGTIELLMEVMSREGVEILSEKIESKYEGKAGMCSCDTPKTKARVTSSAAKDAVLKLRDRLLEVVGGE